jgi:hypothetical protein
MLKMNRFKLPFRFSARKWHAWISFVLALPILLVAITAMLITHGPTLGFRDINVNASWLPGYPAITKREVAVTLHLPGALWIGTATGLFVQSAAGVFEIEKFSGQEIRTLLRVDNEVFVLTAQGLFARQNDRWEKITRGPVNSAYADDGAIYTLSRGKGLQTSRDGGASWQEVTDAPTALSQLPPISSVPATTILARVIRDIHTGDALLGKERGWIWVDAVGGTMTFLGITGLVLWWKGQRRVVASKWRRSAL